MTRSIIALAAGTLGILLISGQAPAATYHITPSGNGATDLNNLQSRFDNLVAGDTVLLGGGDYYPNIRDSYNNLLILGKNGTAGSWITIKNEPGQHPVLHLGNHGGSTGLSINNCSFMRVEGLELAGNPNNTCGGTGGGDWNGGVSHDMQFVNNIVHDFGNSGIGGNGSQDLIEGNIIYNCCHTGDAGYSGIDFYEPHLQATDNSHFGGALGNPNNQYSLIIRNNTVFSNRMNVNEVIRDGSGNIVYDFGRPVDGNGIILDKFSYPAEGANYTGRTLVANNVVYDNGGAGIFAFHSSHIDLFNNTCYHNARNVQGSVELGVAESDSSDCYAYNNIVVTDGQYYNTTGSSVSLGANAWFDNNLYYGPGSFVTNGNDIVGQNPRFIREGTDGSADFHVVPGSPAIGSGLGLWQINYDHDSAPRSGAYDRGAYQSNTPPIGQRISLHAASGYYVTCDLNDGSNLKANQATSVLDWEQFDVVDAGNDMIALRSNASGYYVSVDMNMSTLLRAAWSTGIGEWEKFRWVNANGGFALKANANGNYVTCDLGNADYLKAAWATSIQGWEVFVDPPLGLAPPSNLKAVVSSGKINLTWAGTGLPGVTYSVYRGTAAGKESTTAVKTGLTTAAWTDAAVVKGTTYYYTVKAVKSPQTSSASKEVSAKP